MRDTTAIIQVSGVTFGMLTQADSKLRTLDDVFDCARAQPGRLTEATKSVATGGRAHASGQLAVVRRGGPIKDSRR